jgi:hypothetical protein
MEVLQKAAESHSIENGGEIIPYVLILDWNA